MRVFVFLAALFGFIFNFTGVMFADEIWEAVPGISEADLKEIAVDTYNEGILYASSSKTLYRTEDGGARWEAVFSVDGQDNTINFIGISREGVFVCTGDGLFKSRDGRSGWKKVFGKITKEENQILHIAFAKDRKIYLGTAKGLFSSGDNAFTWEKDDGVAGNIGVRWIDFLKDTVFIATEKGAYRKLTHGWKRVFVTSASVSNTREEESLLIDEDEPIAEENRVNSLLVNDGILHLAAEKGIFVTNDKGNSWSRFSSAGLATQEVKRILFKERLFAVTNEGIFVFSEESRVWKAVYKGMSNGKTHSVSADTEGILWAATEKGLYKMKLEGASLLAGEESSLEDREKEILRKFNREPSINEVQKIAIEYADVHPDKIAVWRREAKRKALFPELSVGIDQSEGDYYYSGTWRGRDKDTGWDISLSWDFGDLVWNSDQTNIDVRSRLMVQLRDDILDEITRTYFERRRLQMDVYLLQNSQDLKQRLQNELRLQELTADLDALTGGYFSYTIKQAEKQEF